MFYECVFLVKDALVDQRREKFVELIGSVHLQKGVELDIVPSMRPTPGVHVLLLDLLVHLHVLTVVEHEEEDDCMHLIDEEVRAIVINFDDAGHDALVLGLIEFYLRDFVKKQLNVLPS